MDPSFSSVESLAIYTYLALVERGGTQYVKVGHTAADLYGYLAKWQRYTTEAELVGYIVSSMASYEYLVLHLIKNAGLMPSLAREYFEGSSLESIEEIFYTVSAITGENYVPA